MDPLNFDALRVSPVFATLPKGTQELQESVMSIAKDIAPSPTPMMGDVPEIPK